MNAQLVLEMHRINTRKTNRQASGVAARQLSSMAAAVALGVLCVQADVLLLAPVWLCAIVFIGTRFRAINNMSHECGHHAFAASRRVNDAFGHLFALLELSAFRRISAEHQTHHRFLGDYARDLDFARLERFAFHEPIGRARIIGHVRDAVILRHLGVYFFCVLSDPHEPGWARCLRTALLLGVVTATIAFPVEAGLFVLVPFIYAYQIDKYLMDYIDHGGLLRESSPVRMTRNVIVRNRVLRELFFPRTDCYHLVHHLFPFLSVEVLPAAHALLMEHCPGYADIEHAWAGQFARYWARP
jgi:fatty acid desaturase